MSCSSAVTIRRSRYSKPASVARRSAARCVATPCRRKRSGAASHTDERSKKTKGRAPRGRPREEVEAPPPPRQSLDSFGREELDGLDDRLDAATGATLDLVGE